MTHAYDQSETTVMTYTYDPSKLTDAGVDQMRFELGDVEVRGQADTTALCDEEYAAVIEKATTTDKRGWTWAKFLCLKAILMRFSLEVDFSAGGASIQLSQRYERWKELYKQMKSTFTVPTASSSSIDGSHYFHMDMMNNPMDGTSHPFGIPNREVGVRRDDPIHSGSGKT